MSAKRLIVALDFSHIDEVQALIPKLDPKKCLVKVGLQLYLSQGTKILDLLSNAGFEIFLDLKLHDIPNTVGKAISEIEKFNIAMTTIHLQGGEAMIEAALSAANQTKILGVSLLTSLNDHDIEDLYASDFDSQFKRLIELAKQTKIDGIVCSPNELTKLTDYSGLKVVPGIRNRDLNDDQKRSMTASQAYTNGADYIVVGRPITKADSIEEALKEYES